MSGCFSFRFLENLSDKRPCLAIFFSGDISIDTVVKETKADVERNLVPKAVFIIGSQTKLSNSTSLFEDKSLLSEIDSFVGTPKERLKILSFNSEGILYDVVQAKTVADDFTKRLITSGMLEIFKKRKGLIVASPNFHFLKPSGDHCDSFIRASNLLVAGDEVAFLAIAILPYLHCGLKRIYVDTSSIAYLVSMAVLMSGKFTSNIPAIESFESYAALSENFDFVEDETSLVLVSATMSGSLANKIKTQTAFEYKQIITLFYGKLILGQIGVFDIQSVTPADMRSYKPEDCVLCKQNYRLVRIVGDQFLPETPANEQLLIRKVDFSKERESFFKEFASKGLLKWSVLANPAANSAEHFYIDVEQFLSTPSVEFIDLLEAKVNKYFARNVKTVIYLNDQGSAALMQAIKQKIGDDASIAWVSLADVVPAELEVASSVIVIAGAITSGRKLLDASRKLRVLERKSSITYITGFSKLPTAEGLGQLKRDLEMGGHELIVLRTCPMPRITSHTPTAWDIELQYLRDWDPETLFAAGKEPLPPVLQTRFNAFSENVAEPEELFLPSPSGQLLKLRQTFAFWSSINVPTETATQSDVYWTIQAILHDLRSKVEGGLGSIYHTTVLSPACFDRYNDGVIQAALLRSASPLELNYKIDEEISRKMADVVISVVDNWSGDQGEAVFEFLLAITIGRMKLHKDHIKNITDSLIKNAAQGAEFIFFAKKLKQYFLN